MRENKKGIENNNTRGGHESRRKWEKVMKVMNNGGKEGAHQPPLLRDKKINLTAEVHMDTCGVIDREVGGGGGKGGLNTE